LVADIVVVLRTIVAIDIVGIIIDIVGIVVVLDIVGTVVVGFRTLVIEVFAILAVDTVGIAILVVVIQVAGIEGIIARVVDIVVVMARIAISRFVSVPSFVGGGFALFPSQSYQMHEIWPRSSICFGWILYLCLKRSVEHVPWRDLIIWSGCLVGGF